MEPTDSETATAAAQAVTQGGEAPRRVRQAAAVEATAAAADRPVQRASMTA